MESSSVPAAAGSPFRPHAFRWRWILIPTGLVALLAYAVPQFLWSPPARRIEAGSAAGPASPPAAPAPGAALPAVVNQSAATDAPRRAPERAEEPARPRSVAATPAPKPFPMATGSLETRPPAPKLVALLPPEQPGTSIGARIPLGPALGSHLAASAPPPAAAGPVPQAKAAVEPAAPPRAAAAVSTVRAPAVLRRVPPTYPPLAKQARVAGTVRLTALIGTDGRVKEVASVSGPYPLRQAAIDAVRRWLFEPALLNGQAVEFRHSVDVVFTLR